MSSNDLLLEIARLRAALYRIAKAKYIYNGELQKMASDALMASDSRIESTSNEGKLK